MRIPLLITLQDDLVISASSATTGGHESLDYLPGSLLFGVAASRLYAELKKQDKNREARSSRRSRRDQQETQTHIFEKSSNTRARQQEKAE